MSKTIDTFNTYYKFNKTSEETPIIFIHGIGLTHEIWDQQIKFFKKKKIQSFMILLVTEILL